MWFKIRDISVSDRLRSRWGLNGSIAQTTCVVDTNRSLPDWPSDSLSGVNELVHAGEIPGNTLAQIFSVRRGM